jgi:hypothetical protein
VLLRNGTGSGVANRREAQQPQRADVVEDAVKLREEVTYPLALVNTIQS